MPLTCTTVVDVTGFPSAQSSNGYKVHRHLVVERANGLDGWRRESVAQRKEDWLWKDCFNNLYFRAQIDYVTTPGGNSLYALVRFKVSNLLLKRLHTPKRRQGTMVASWEGGLSSAKSQEASRINWALMMSDKQAKPMESMAFQKFLEQRRN